MRERGDNTKPVHWSLEHLRQEKYVLYIFCDNSECRPRHSKTLDWDDLIARFGPDYVFAGEEKRAEFLSHFRCSQCGGKALSLIMTPPGK